MQGTWFPTTAPRLRLESAGFRFWVSDSGLAKPATALNGLKPDT